MFFSQTILGLLFLALTPDLIPVWPLASIEDHSAVRRPLSWNCILAQWSRPHQWEEQELYLKLWRHSKRKSSLLWKMRRQSRGSSSSLSRCLHLSFPLWLIVGHKQSKPWRGQWSSYARRTKRKMSGFRSWSERWVISTCVWMTSSNTDDETPSGFLDSPRPHRAQPMTKYSGCATGGWTSSLRLPWTK